MMKVYTMIIEDRHTDVEVTLFQNKDDAINTATKSVKEWGAKWPEDIEERYDVHGWLYHGVYSCEGDSVTVIESEIKGRK